MYKLKIITSTVREGRKGPFVAKWIAKEALKNESFSVEVIDLGDIKLPISTEPNHPSTGKYDHEITKTWSKMINDADAFIFVLAEYNYSYPAPIKNALDYLSKEWNYKPAGIVSYGGVSAGTRSAAKLSNIFTILRMVPIADMVNLPFFEQYLNKETKEFNPGETSENAAQKMLKELLLWTKALKTLREEKE